MTTRPDPEQRTAESMIATALEMDPELLPFAPELLADLDALGADVPLIVSTIAALGTGPDATIVDLGSGKGAASIELARTLGCAVHGIELFEPFVHTARDAAEAAGISARCRFTHGDIVQLAGTLPPADVAVFAALGDVLGPLDDTVGILRRYVRPGGHIVINDCCRRDSSSATFPGFEHCVTLAGTRPLLTAHGDELVAELLEADDDATGDHAIDDHAIDEAAVIAARAAGLARRHPALAPKLQAFVDSQRAEYDFLDQHTIGVVWVLRRR